MDHDMKVTCCRRNSPAYLIIPSIYCCNLVRKTVQQAMPDVNGVLSSESTL